MSTPRPFERLAAPADGVEVWLRDETAAYGYTNLFTVRLRVRLTAPGAPVPHERVLERTGVYAEQVEAVRAELLEGFLARVGPYLARPGFAARLAAHLGRRAVRAAAGGGYG